VSTTETPLLFTQNLTVQIAGGCRLQWLLKFHYCSSPVACGSNLFQTTPSRPSTVWLGGRCGPCSGPLRLRRSHGFMVNLLASDQSKLSQCFAAPFLWGLRAACIESESVAALRAVDSLNERLVLCRNYFHMPTNCTVNSLRERLRQIRDSPPLTCCASEATRVGSADGQLPHTKIKLKCEDGCRGCIALSGLA